MGSGREGSQRGFQPAIRKGNGPEAFADLSASGATRIAGSRNFKTKYAPAFPLVAITQTNAGNVTDSAMLELAGFVAPPEETRPAAKAAPFEFHRSGAAGRHGQAIKFVFRAHREPTARISRTSAAPISHGAGRRLNGAGAGNIPPNRLMTLSSKAKENGEAYATATATPCDALASKGNPTEPSQNHGPNEPPPCSLRRSRSIFWPGFREGQGRAARKNLTPDPYSPSPLSGQGREPPTSPPDAKRATDDLNASSRKQSIGVRNPLLGGSAIHATRGTTNGDLTWPSFRRPDQHANYSKKICTLQDENAKLSARVDALEKGARSDDDFDLKIVDKIHLLDLRVIELMEKVFPGWARTQVQIMGLFKSKDPAD